MRTDPVTLQMMRNHTRAAAESMANTLYRTAHSTFVKETEDFTMQLLDAYGENLRLPRDLGATWYPGLDYGEAIALVPGGASRATSCHLRSVFGLSRHPLAGHACGGRCSTKASWSPSPADTSTTPTWAAPCPPPCRAR